MFTGIIKEIGKVREFKRTGKVYRLAVESRSIFTGIRAGDSVAVNGVCLTMVEKCKDVLIFDIMEETVRRSGLAGLAEGSTVNLEDALKADSSLGGHFVLGHIDCPGKIDDMAGHGENFVMTISFPKEFGPLLVEKGSVAVDGVSLTVGEVKDLAFTVYLIPHTLKTTVLGSRRVGARVNLEFDIIGKYVARLMKSETKRGITEDFLKDKGF